jgi:hypothetical protein
MSMTICFKRKVVDVSNEHYHKAPKTWEVVDSLSPLVQPNLLHLMSKSFNKMDRKKNNQVVGPSINEESLLKKCKF